MDIKAKILHRTMLKAMQKYWQTDSCYVCNFRSAHQFNLAVPMLNGTISEKTIEIPICAACFASLPFRDIDDNVTLLAWRAYNLYCHCLISTYYQAEICNFIRRYKFHQAAHLAKMLGYILALTYWRYTKALEKRIIHVTPYDLPKIDYVSFVPLHTERKLERSYDQAELLAKNCAKYLELPCQASLLRIRATSRQSSLDHRTERLQNVKDAFTVQNPKCVASKNILLIDDVVSTGSSIMSAAQSLYEAKAYGVLCLAFASNLNSQDCHYVDGYRS